MVWTRKLWARSSIGSSAMANVLIIRVKRALDFEAQLLPEFRTPTAVWRRHKMTKC